MIGPAAMGVGIIDTSRPFTLPARSAADLVVINHNNISNYII
jgi:hypothetical protein